MEANLQHYLQRLDNKVDLVRKLSRPFREAIGLTAFAYVRVYHDGRAGWVTSDSDHDRLLVDSGFLKEDPLIDTAQALRKGHYLWFHDREFPGSQAFYKQRAAHFQIDHGMVVVNHTDHYLETCCFSGCLAKRPLYNIFVNELGLFKAYMQHFTDQISCALLPLFDEGIHLRDLKPVMRHETDLDFDRQAAIANCGFGHLLKLSKREKECLALLGEGMTYAQIASALHLSARTVESYLNTVKNKMGLEFHSDLHRLSHQLMQLGLIAN